MKKLLLLLICLSVSCYFLPATQAQQLDNTMWGTNGRVDAIARSGNTIYIGGLFTQVGPNTGSAVLLNGADGKIAESPQLQVVGPVHAIVPDGKGGWYMGGGFTKVQQLPRRGLAHILPDGSVDPNWSPMVNGTQGVFSLAVAGNRVYAGGTFDTINGQYRRNIAAIDATTGQLTPWNPDASNTVLSLAVFGNLVYVGGKFLGIGNPSRSYLAAVDATTGVVTRWRTAIAGEVSALAISGNTLYAGGSFITGGQELRSNLAAFDLVTGNMTSWNPGANGSVQTLIVSGNTLYAGGFFTTIGGQSRSLIAALDVTTGQVASWNPHLSGRADNTPWPHVKALAFAGNKVFASGNFNRVGTQPCGHVVAIEAVSGQAVPDWNVPVNNVVSALANVGDRLMVGGWFNSIGAQSRRNIAALNATTGEVTAWNPGADARVYALAASGNTVYAGGNFNETGGQRRSHIAALDGTTGQVTSWRPDASNIVYTLSVAGRTVYAGGNFYSIGGRGQAYVAGLDVNTGKATAWNPQVNGDVEALAVTDGVIYIGGRFTTVDGQPRNRIAALNAVSGRATPWNPNADAQVLALAFADNTVYAGGAFSVIGGKSRPFIAALNATTGQATSWNPRLYNYFGRAENAVAERLAVTGNTVYAGGLFHSISGQSRKNLAAIETSNGNATAWNPDLRRYLNSFSEVKALLFQDGQLHVGGDFSEAEGRSIANFAVFGKKIPAPNLITGVVYEDQNGNCTRDAGEKGIANSVIVAQPGNYFTSTDSAGRYTLAVDTGSYTIRQVIGPEDSRFIKQLCPANPLTHMVRFTGAGQTSPSRDFANQIDRRPNLSVHVASDRRRRCFTGLTTITYCNKGLGAAANAKLYVKLPQYVVPVKASSRYTLDQDRNLVFDLATLAADTCGTIYLTDSVVCNNPGIRGLTQCTRAWITPANSRNPGLEWDGADITLKARCGNNGRVRLGIYNMGTGNMADSSAYRVYLDAQLAFTRNFKLAKGDSLILQVPANGRTVRLEAGQRPGHPSRQSTNVTLEACGTNAEGKVSLGFVAQLPQDDAEPEIAEECLPIIDSYDPNDKAVSPGGITDQHYTPTRSRLDYVIRFQNTGTDVAYKVVVADTLSGHLDISTLQVGSVSHPYKVQVSGKGRPVLIFTFNNIMLPDSNANEPRSHGYIQFSIRPKADLPEKTRIENFADIFFDYNEPVRTNTTFNTLYDLPPVPAEAVKLDGTVVCATTNTTAAAGNSRIVCMQDTVLLAARSALGGGRWQRMGGTATVTDPGNPASGVTGLAYGDNVFAWRVAANTCGTDSLAAQVIITRLRQPAAPTISQLGADSLACSLAAGSYEWYLEGNPLELRTRVIKAIQTGRYTVRVTGEAGCQSDLSPAFTWLPTATEPDLVFEVRVYPNPTSGGFVVVLPPDITQPVQFTLGDALGRTVAVRTLPPGMGRERAIRFDVSAEPKGVYLLRVQTDKAVVVGKVCLQ